MEVGRVLGGRALWHRVLQGVHRRPGDQAELTHAHEFAQQRSGTQGTSSTKITPSFTSSHVDNVYFPKVPLASKDTNE